MIHTQKPAKLHIRYMRGGFGLFRIGTNGAACPAFGYAKVEPFMTVSEAQATALHTFGEFAVVGATVL